MVTKQTEATVERFHQLWDRWTASVSLCSRGRGRRQKISPEKYRRLHAELLHSCRQVAMTKKDNAVYLRAEKLVAPWVTLESFAFSDRENLRSLTKQCEEINQLLGRKRRFRISAFIPIVAGLFVLGFLVPAFFTGEPFGWVNMKRLFRQLQFRVASFDPEQTIMVFAAVAVCVSIWMVFQVKSS